MQCDYTGATDASAAFNTALASLPNVNGRAVGKIIFGPGNVRFTVTPNNPGPCVYIEGQGKWADVHQLVRDRRGLLPRVRLVRRVGE